MICDNCGMENALASDVNCWHCGKPVQPRELTWPEMKARLIAAGWKEHEADEEIQSMQEDCESGM